MVDTFLCLPSLYHFIHTFCCAVPGEWHIMGVTLAAGLSLKWFRDNFCQSEVETARNMGVDTYYLMDHEAEKSPIGCNKLLYLPYLMAERTPHLDPDCRGAFIGLSAKHQKRDMIRAVMEGVVYSLRDCNEVLKEMGITSEDMTVCGGGGASSLWRGMLSDTLGVKVNTVTSKEGPALGAAILAGVGAQIYPNVQEACRKIIRIKTEQRPNTINEIEYQKYYDIYRALYPVLKDKYKMLARI
jgi:xylulokinase